MPKRRLEEDDDWSECAAHTGHMMQGAIHDLRHTDPKGVPFERKKYPIGFDISPGQTNGRKHNQVQKVKRPRRRSR